jgi:hypothetical protein
MEKMKKTQWHPKAAIIQQNTKFSIQSLAIFAVIMALISGTLLFRGFAAPNPPTVYLNPASQTVNGSTDFTVEVRENSGTTGVNAVQANLSYNASILDFVSIDGSTSAFDVQAQNSGGSGSIAIGRGKTTGVTGDQLIAIIHFKSKTVAGTTNIAFTTGTQLVSATTNVNIMPSLSSTAGDAVTVDLAAPSVNITAPTSGSTVTGSAVTVSANSSDDVAVAGVQFKLDGVNLGTEDTTSPYSVAWNSTATSNGTHTLSAVARDASNKTTTSSSISVNVSNGSTTPPPTTPPPVSPPPSGTPTSPAVYLSPSSIASINSNTNFTVEIRENSGTSTVNAVQANLTYIATNLDFVSIDSSSSAFDIQAQSTGGSGSVIVARGKSGAVLTGDQTVAVVHFKTKTVGGLTSIYVDNGTQLISSTTNTSLFTSPSRAWGTSVNVITTPPPTVTLLGSPTSIFSGGSTMLSWSSTNATSCTASNGWTGTKTTSGSQSVNPTATTTYTLSCVGAGGSSPASSVTVTVAGKIGDTNGDNLVDIFDVSILLSHWGTNFTYADFDKSGTVDIFDLSIVLSHFGT